jgi:2-oxoglutarate ferredoxin oxidoreductase subunit alpha
MKMLMKGTEAIAEAAIRAGCRLYFGYPITPQSELPEYMAKRMPQIKGMFLQSESEVATVNMIYGAACTGQRVMTSTSSPGFSLMQEGISYMAGAELPAVFINVMRGGPGLGDIQPSQSDYFQATKGGGHGDYRMIVIAPYTIQEAADLMGEAFDLAFKYRMLVTILADGMIGQMMEPVELPEWKNVDEFSTPDWALTGTEGRVPRKITSFDINPYELEKMNLRYQATYQKVIENEIRYEEINTKDAELIVVAYGTTARIVKTVIDMAKKDGIKVGLFRPITLWPFPYKRLSELSSNVKNVLTVEMSYGQMVEDVKLAVEGKADTPFFGRSAGVVPTPAEILEAIKKIVRR